MRRKLDRKLTKPGFLPDKQIRQKISKSCVKTAVKNFNAALNSKNYGNPFLRCLGRTDAGSWRKYVENIMNFQGNFYRTETLDGKVIKAALNF